MVSIEEVFSTDNIKVSQCDTREIFVLEFEGKHIEFKLCDFVKFKRKIQAVDLVEMFDVNSPDVAIIHLPHCRDILVLSIRQVLEFRKLLNGTFDTLALNSQVHRTLRLYHLKAN